MSHYRIIDDAISERQLNNRVSQAQVLSPLPGIVVKSTDILVDFLIRKGLIVALLNVMVLI